MVISGDLTSITSPVIYPNLTPSSQISCQKSVKDISKGVSRVKPKQNSRAPSEELHHPKVNQAWSTISHSKTPSAQSDLDESYFEVSRKSELDVSIEEAPKTFRPSSTEVEDSDRSCLFYRKINEKYNNHSFTDTSLGISRFQFGSTDSFNTSVHDLIQQEPDTPIGGNRIVPETQLLVDTSCKNLPRIKVYNISGPSKFARGNSKPAKALQPKFHNPSYVIKSSDNVSITLINVPGTIKARKSLHRSIEPSEVSHNISAEISGGNTKLTIARVSLIPDSITNPKNSFFTQRNKEFVASLKDEQALKSPSESRGLNKSLVDPNVPVITSLGTPVSADSTRITSSTENQFDSWLIDSLPSSSELKTSGIPVDGTGLFVASSNSRMAVPIIVEGKNTIRRVYRMTRRVLLKKKVLQILFGRDLAETAKELIEQSSKVSEEIAHVETIPI